MSLQTCCRIVRSAFLLVAVVPWEVAAGDDNPTAASRPGPAPASRPIAAPARAVIFKQSEIEARIRAELAKPTEFDYQDIGLEAVAGDIAARHKIPVVLDHAALIADGKGSESVLVGRAVGGSLKTDLTSLLNPQGLTYVVSRDRLLITTLTASETMTEARVYPVADLVIAAGDDDASQLTFDKLIELISSSIDPETWREAGGTQGEIKAFESAGVMALVVTQTEDAHEKVEQLLTDLRSANDEHVRNVQVRRPKSLAQARPAPKTPNAINCWPSGSQLPVKPVLIDEIVQANNGLAVQMYRTLAKSAAPSRNLVFSSTGVLNALVPVYAGAAGDTQVEFQRALDLPSQETALPQLSQLQHWLTAESPERKYSWQSRTRLFVRPDERLLASFVEANFRHFALMPTPFLFGEGGKRTQLVEQLRSDNGGRLDPAAMVDQLDGETRLAVFNTVTFRAPWDKPFPERRTGFAQFHTPGGDEQVQMMQATERLHYAEADGVQIVRKKYAGDRDGGETAFYILLPANRSDFERLEGGLTLPQLNGRIVALKPENVHLQLPRFILADQMDLTEMLQELGLRTAFDDSPETTADFRGINGERGLFLKRVVQQAQIEVNERETEAVAVTGIFGGMMGSSERPAPPIEMRCDRPFMFLIRDEQTGAVLFMGRIADPSN